MRAIGVSTGAIARGDLDAAWTILQEHGVTTVEFSALREHELLDLVTWVDRHDLSGLASVSVHAPSRRVEMSEEDVVDRLGFCIDRGWRLIAHPEAIDCAPLWADFGRLLCIENTDRRKLGRTPDELHGLFEALPEASFCLDLGHARQIDPTMGVARALLQAFGSRLAQLHLSEVDEECQHQPIGRTMVAAVQSIRTLIPDAPAIIESHVPAQGLDREVVMATRCFRED